jgi:hypothetical protein
VRPPFPHGLSSHIHTGSRTFVYVNRKEAPITRLRGAASPQGMYHYLSTTMWSGTATFTRVNRTPSGGCYFQGSSQTLNGLGGRVFLHTGARNHYQSPGHIRKRLATLHAAVRHFPCGPGSKRIGRLRTLTTYTSPFYSFWVGATSSTANTRLYRGRTWPYQLATLCP